MKNLMMNFFEARKFHFDVKFAVWIFNGHFDFPPREESKSKKKFKTQIWHQNEIRELQNNSKSSNFAFLPRHLIINIILSFYGWIPFGVARLSTRSRIFIVRIWLNIMAIPESYTYWKTSFDCIQTWKQW